MSNATSYAHRRRVTRYEDRRAEGTCVQCGRKPAMDDHAMCRACNDKENARVRVQFNAHKGKAVPGNFGARNGRKPRVEERGKQYGRTDYPQNTKQRATAGLETMRSPTLIPATRMKPLRRDQPPQGRAPRSYAPQTGYGGPKVERPGPPSAPAMIPERVAPSLVLF